MTFIPVIEENVKNEPETRWANPGHEKEIMNASTPLSPYVRSCLWWLGRFSGSTWP